MNNLKCAAGIVLYNPELNRLKQNLVAVFKQVDVVYCFDNGSMNIVQIKSLLSSFNNVILIEGGNNYGLGYAINRIGELAIDTGYQWLLLLDQDSVCPQHIISKFCSYIGEKDAVLCPAIIDRRIVNPCISNNSVEYVNRCITSGSFINLEVWEKIGKHDEFLFIDHVDYEFSYRVIKSGYKIRKINDVVLDHEFGDIIPKKYGAVYTQIAKITGIRKLGALAYERPVNPLRVRNMVRNTKYLYSKYKYDKIKPFSYCELLMIMLMNLIRGDNRFDIIKSCYLGYKDWNE